MSTGICLDIRSGGAARSAVVDRAALMFIAALLSAACMAAPPGPGAPMTNPAGPMAGSLEHSDDEHVGRFDQLASLPSRPTWAPLPLLREDVAAVPLLLAALQSPDHAPRERAAFLLGQIGSREAISPLVCALNDDRRQVRIHAAIALGCMGDRRGMHGSIAALRGQPAWVRYYAALALWHIQGNDTSAQPLIRRELQQALNGAPPIAVTAIEGALTSPYVAPPPVENVSEKPAEGPPMPEEQMWEQAADVLIAESDWWYHCGDYDQAIRCSEASILLDPDYVETYSVVAWLEWSMGRNVDAIGTLHRAIGAAPMDPDSWNALGFHYFNIGEYEKAEPPLAQAVALKGDHLAYRTYAHCLERLGKTEKSLAVWEELMEMRPDDGSVKLNYERVKAAVAGE
ncbi:MAG: HEAT repeat domain-containing protein [Armatimonadetes bacterium]|nr:HEAT repeat domain-containing protein [Armatimonadota bacterium]